MEKQKRRGRGLGLNALLCLLTLLSVGCSSDDESPKPEPHRARIAEHWTHSISDGTPHRMTVLRDGTEILTIGHHSHGRFLLLIRYRDEERFAVVDDAGEFSEFVESVD